MKNFEKWFNDFDCDTIDCGGIGCDTICYQIRKETWRAALLWYYKTAEHLSPSDCDLIDKELEDETEKD